MTKHSKFSLTVQDLISTLEDPPLRPTKKLTEPVVDREEVRKHLRIKWKGTFSKS